MIQQYICSHTSVHIQNKMSFFLESSNKMMGYKEECKLHQGQFKYQCSCVSCSHCGQTKATNNSCQACVILRNVMTNSGMQIPTYGQPTIIERNSNIVINNVTNNYNYDQKTVATRVAVQPQVQYQPQVQQQQTNKRFQCQTYLRPSSAACA